MRENDSARTNTNPGLPRRKISGATSPLASFAAIGNTVDPPYTKCRIKLLYVVGNKG